MRAGKRRYVKATGVMLVVLMALGTLGGLRPAGADLPVGSDQDITAPTIVSFSLSPTAVDVRTASQNITATIHATDDLSGIAEIVLNYRSPSGGQFLTFWFHDHSLTSGTLLDGVLTSSITVDNTKESGTWTVTGVSIEDAIGNRRSYSQSDTAAMGTASFDVTSDRDATLPQLHAVRFTPDPVDVSAADGQIAFEFDFSDEGGSGISAIQAILWSPSRRQNVRVNSSGHVDLIAGTVHDGTLRGRAITLNVTPAGNSPSGIGIPMASEPGDWLFNSIQAVDKAGNRHAYFGDTLTPLVPDPLTVVSDPYDQDLPAISAFRFSPSTIDVTAGPATVNVEIDVTEDLAGVRAAWLTFKSPTISGVSPANIRRTADRRLALSPKVLNGTLTGAVTFPQFDRGGNWIVETVCVADWVGWQRCYSGPDLDTLGPGGGIIVVINHPPVVEVTGTQDGATYPADQEPVPGCDVQDVEDGVVQVQPTVSPLSADRTRTVTCTYADSGGKTGTDTVTYTLEEPLNSAPDAVDDQVTTDEDTSVVVDVAANDTDPDGNLLPSTTTVVSGTANGSLTNHGDGTFTYTPAANFNGADGFRYEICDTEGLCDQADVTITVNPVNDAPVAENDGYTTDEDTTLTVAPPGTLANDSDIDGNSPTANTAPVTGPTNGTLTLNADGSFTYTPTANFNGQDNFTYEIDDGNGGTDTATVTLTVNPVNDPPVITGLTCPGPDPVPVGTTVGLEAVFTDPDTGDTHTASIDWEETTTDGTVSGGIVSGSHTYTAAGIYAVKVTISDAAGATDTAACESTMVVYDPDGGFVTGGGWVHSPEGAYAADPGLTGRASFGFLSKYQKGAKIPTGQTEFQFKAGDLNFHSSSYEWLVISGARAQYKGTGTINGTGSYQFMLTAIDGQVNGGGDVDRFRIKIWNDSGVVYDNQMGADDGADPATALTQGSIQIKKAK